MKMVFVGIMLLGLGLVGWSGYQFLGKNSKKTTPVVASGEDFASRQETLLSQITEASLTRYGLFQEMIDKRQLDKKTSEQVLATIEVLKAVKLASQDEIDRFEQLNLTLTNALTTYLSANKKDLNNPNSDANQWMRKFEENGRAIDKLKMNHSQLIKDNQSKGQSPYFRAAMLVLEASNTPTNQ